MANPTGISTAPMVANSRIKAVAFVGMVLFFTGLVLTGYYGAFSRLSSALCVLGILLGSALFLPRVTRNLRLYVNMTLYSVFVILTLVMLFLVLRRHPASYDSTRSRLYSISEVTRAFLQRLNQPVRVTAFLTEAGKDDATQLLGEYQRYNHGFTYEVYNPFRDVAVARRYGLNVSPGDVFVESLTTDTQTVLRTVKLTRLREEELTNGIIQLLRGRDVVLYFLTGHGEMSIESDRAAATLGNRRVRMDELVWLKEQLEASYIKVVPLSLAQRGKVPSDASAVVMVAPKTDITSSERTALQEYLDAGGRGIFLLNPDTSQAARDSRLPLRSLTELVEQYGFELPREIAAVAPQGNTANQDMFSVPVQFRKSPITQFSSDEAFFLNPARIVAPSKVPPPNAIVDVFMESPADGRRVGLDDLAAAVAKRERLTVNTDPKNAGAQPLGASVTILPPGTPEERATKLVVIGNGNFVSTGLISQKGWLLFLNTVNWMTSSGDLIAIPTARIENTPVILSDGQKQFLFLLTVIIVPTLITIFGLGYSISKRELA
ncbi:MAG: GldG family protein [Candidatus Sumerlaeaceae bacterium]|nr:GldG family protein [Candidatus Sumerlaeaceae bacterium]